MRKSSTLVARCIISFFFVGLGLKSCKKFAGAVDKAPDEMQGVADEMVSWIAHEHNPVFKGTGEDTWDRNIRERGYILKEDDGYHMWYTGYRGDTNDPVMALGYATSDEEFSGSVTREIPYTIRTGSKT